MTCRAVGTPRARAASTNSFSRSERNWARTRRATGIHRRQPMGTTMRTNIPSSTPSTPFTASRNR